MPGTIDLNCDIGEFAPGDPSDVDELLFPLISSANIACGFHAGDDNSMRRSVALAQRFDVGTGAHVSFLDREGFGRRVLPFTTQQLASQTVQQIEALLSAMSGSGASLTHVKPHGALYSVLAADFAAANSVAAAVRSIDAGLALFGPAGSAMQEAATANQLSFVAEGFPERGYRAAAELQPRGEEGAIVEDPTEVGRRAVAMALGRPVPTVGGDRIVVPADTVCVHSDHPTAVQNAKAIRAALAAAGVVVRAAR